MLTHEIYLLVTCVVTLTSAIRVDWNTNKGPIVPPTPRTTIRPRPPYREPAPVWEDQSNDIPNPNPYVYVLPPPSRPRPATNNYLTSDRKPVTQRNYNNYNNNKNYGYILTPNQGNPYSTNSVAGLTVKYVPNVGNKYYAVVPSGKTAYGGAKLQAAAAAATGYYFDSIGGSSGGNGGNGGDKLQGKYNAKTKKYKVYEKVKYTVPTSNYFPMFYYQQSQKQQQQYDQQFAQQELLESQLLPMIGTVQPFRAETTTTTTTEAITAEEQQQQQQHEEQQQRVQQQQNQQLIAAVSKLSKTLTSMTSSNKKTEEIKQS